MARAIEAKIGADAVLTLQFSTNADTLLMDDIQRLLATVSKGKKEKSFSIGDAQSGRAEVKKNWGDSWKAKGVDGAVEGRKWVFNKVIGETFDIDGVAREMARQLAFLTADVDDIASKIERKFGIDINIDELSELISANIEYSGMVRDF